MIEKPGRLLRGFFHCKSIARVLFTGGLQYNKINLHRNASTVFSE